MTNRVVYWNKERYHEYKRISHKGNLMLAKNSLTLAKQGYELMDKNGIS